MRLEQRPLLPLLTGCIFSQPRRQAHPGDSSHCRAPNRCEDGQACTAATQRPVGSAHILSDWERCAVVSLAQACADFTYKRKMFSRELNVSSTFCIASVIAWLTLEARRLRALEGISCAEVLSSYQISAFDAGSQAKEFGGNG
jgi:hypothetical protein